MANHIKRGESLFLPFRDGLSIFDSQNKPRMYKTKNMFEKAFPVHYLGKDGVELVEYSEVRHGRWMKDEMGNTYCSTCGRSIPTVHFREEYQDYFSEWDEEIPETDYCPNCGAEMKGEEDA